MPKILIAGQIHPTGMSLLRADPNLEIQVISDPGAGLSKDLLANIDALLIRYGVVSESDAAAMPNLKIVSRHGVGCDNLPTDALAKRGIPVTIVGPVNAVSVAEQVMAMLLTLKKCIASYDEAVRNGNWAIRESLQVTELAHRQFLLLGFGRIGKEVARRAAAFDMQVRVFDPYVSNSEIELHGFGPLDDWQDAICEADVVSLHLPLTAQTRNIISKSVLEKMKPTAILINAARGGLIDEEALYAALLGRMSQGGAALDCFEKEPVPPDHPLLLLRNVVVSPHSAALSQEAAQRMGQVAAQNVIDGLNGTLGPHLVFNREKLREAGYVI